MNNTILFQSKSILMKYPFLAGFFLTLFISFPCMLVLFIFNSVQSKMQSQPLSQEPTPQFTSDSFTPHPNLPAGTSSSPTPSITPIEPTQPHASSPSYPQPSQPMPTMFIQPTPTSPPNSDAALSRTSQQPTHTPSTAMFSHGVGTDRILWEQEHGPSSQTQQGFEQYEQGAFTIQFQDDIVWHLERNWGRKDALPVQDARALAQRLIPTDSTFLGTNAPNESTIIDLYHSNWLSNRYGDHTEIWNGGHPGNFTILYHLSEGRTEKVAISLGNNAESEYMQ